MADQIPVSLEELRVLLRFIPADSRETWVQVGMGIKDEFGTNGWDAWDTWSQSGTGYKLSDAKSVWKSFRKAGTGLGTVIKLAMDNGWTPEKTELTAEDKRRFARDHEARRIARQAEVEADEALLERMRAKVAAECAVIWAQHTTTDGKSAYLDKKQVGVFGVAFMRHTVVLEIDDQAERCQRWVGEDAQQYLKSVPSPRPAHLSMLVLRRGDMVMPLRDEAGHLHSLQQVSSTGKKLFPKYGRKSGCFHVVADNAEAEVVGLAEGYATAASCHMAAGWPVVVAIDSGNLPKVAARIRAMYPAARLVICGDDDPATAGNPGRTKAELAAQQCGAVAVFPQGAEGKDWNDLHVGQGLDVVREQLLAALQVEPAVVAEDLPRTPSVEGAPQNPTTATTGGAGEALTLAQVVRRYALVEGTTQVWDIDKALLMKKPAFEALVGKPLTKEWLALVDDTRRTVSADQVRDIQQAKRMAGKKGGALGMPPLERYVYIDGTKDVWDRQKKRRVPEGAVKMALGDAYALWLNSAERRVVDVEHIVFEVNNLFPDISRLDRTAGRINLRKVSAGVMTSNSDAYLGAHGIITQGPADPRVSVLLFNTGSQTDVRSDAQNAIESYVAAASTAQFDLLGTQLAGQRAIACVQREEQRIPEIGEVYQLATATQQQYVQLAGVEARLEQFTFDYGNGNFINFTRRRLDLQISAPLLNEFPGGQVSPAGTGAISLDGKAKARVLATQIADAARYYGISPLAEAVAQGALNLRVKSVYSQLVPSTTKESPLVDVLGGYQRQIYVPAGPSRAVSLTGAVGAIAGEARTFLGTGCAPGTLTLTANGGTYADDSKGALRFVSGSNWLSSGAVDYQTGELTLTRTGTSWSGSASATYRPGAAATGDTLTGEVEIALGNRGYVYTLNLSGAVPRAGTLSVSYMALGKWYELRDFGDGLLTGEGAGTISFGSGTVSLTLNALPDVGSSLIYSYVSTADNAIVQRAGASVVPVIEVRHTLPEGGVLPGSVSISYTAGTARTLTDDGKGVLSGTGGTGTIAYASGEIVMLLSATPASGIAYSYQVGAVLGTPLTVTSDASGMATFTLPGAPLKPGSVRVDWLTTQRQAAPAVNWGAVESGNALPVYDGYRDIAQVANDNGNGGWQGGRTGSINYTTGACTLQVARLYDYVEYTYSNTSRPGPGGLFYVTKPVLVTTTVQLREQFGGTLSTQAQAAGVSVTPQTSSQAQPPITVNLLPDVAEGIVPGSLLFSWNGALYCDRSGLLYRDVASNTNGGVAVGTVNYAARTATLNSYAGNAAGPVSLLACLTAAVGFSVTGATFRTPGAPLRPGSMQITVVRSDTAEIVTAVANLNGEFASGIIHGSVDTATGIARLAFTSNPADQTGASDVPVIPLLLRYNAVVQTRLPLNAGLLGLDPVRLPSDGRVPIYRDGEVLVIHHTAETFIASPTPGATVMLDRQQQAEIEVVDGNGLRLREDAYSVNRELGSVTWANPLVLQDAIGNPLSLPLIIRDRVEHMTLCTEVQITGALGISSPLPWDLPATDTKVSSAVAWGDLQARVWNWFTQQTWSQGAPNWTDQVQGNTTTAQYNSLSYPQIITNAGAIVGKWALVFTSATAFNVVEEKLGVISTGNTTNDCSPINALTNQPYFTIRKEGWGSGWAAANAVRFNTDAALGPMWVIRTVISGQGTVDDDQFKLQIRGDAD